MPHVTGNSARSTPGAHRGGLLARVGGAPGMALLLAAYALARLWSVFGVEARVFPDSAAYMSVAARAPWDTEFYLGGRAPIVPLLFRIAGRDPGAIIIIQAVLSAVAWGVLALVVAAAVREPRLRAAALLATLAFGATTQIGAWDAALLAESIALSLTALLLACGLRLATRWSGALLAAFAVVALLWSLTRDANAYIALLAGIAGVLAAGLWRLRGKPPAATRSLLIAGALTGAAAVAIPLSNAAVRWEKPLWNVLTQRILTDQRASAYFSARGMPASAEVAALRDRWADGSIRRAAEYADLRQWILETGRSTYAAWLLGRPLPTVTDPLRHSRQLFGNAFTHYVAPGYRRLLPRKLDALLFPRKVWLLGLLALVAAGVATVTACRRGSGVLLLAAIWFVVLSVAGVIFTWHADAMEVARHGLLPAVVLRLALGLVLLFGLDGLLHGSRAADSSPRSDRRRR